MRFSTQHKYGTFSYNTMPNYYSQRDSVIYNKQIELFLENRSILHEQCQVFSLGICTKILWTSESVD